MKSKNIIGILLSFSLLFVSTSTFAKQSDPQCAIEEIQNKAKKIAIDDGLKNIEITIGDPSILKEIDDSFNACRQAMDIFTDVVTGKFGIASIDWSGVAAAIMAKTRNVIIELVKKKIKETCDKAFGKLTGFIDKLNVNALLGENSIGSAIGSVTVGDGVQVNIDFQEYDNLDELINGVF